MDKDKLPRVLVALVAAFFITSYLSQRLFIAGTPYINDTFVRSLPQEALRLIAPVLTARVTPTPWPTAVPTVLPTPLPPTATPWPTSPPPTSTPTPWPTPRPSSTPRPTTAPPVFACPATSTKTYSSRPVSSSDPEKLKGDLSQNPDVNLLLRGYGAVNQGAHLISRNGNGYGLDNVMPPQISSLFSGTVPSIAKTYIIYEWDFGNKKSLKPQPATPSNPVHVLGLTTTPGQPLLGLKAGRDIGGGNVFLVLYATRNYILFTHSGGDNLKDGYLFYFFDLCVDPNLLAEYAKDAAERSRLPVIAPGQVFGYGRGDDVKIVVRDTMSFMDTRYREDWWEYK